MRIKHQGGPADGLVLDAAPNVTEETEKVALFERCSPPRVHHYVQRRHSNGHRARTAAGDLIYAYERTLPTQRGE